MSVQRGWRRIAWLVIALLAGALAVRVADTFRFDPDPNADQEFIRRAMQKSVPGLTVSVSALGPRESRRSFGAALAKYDIQPIWLAIENETDEPLQYLSIVTDPDYYSPFEVAYRFHGAISVSANNARDKFFLERQISNVLPAHARTTGFVYSVLDAGMKYVRILISGKNRRESFDFNLPVPGPAFVGQNVALQDLYPNQPIKDLDLDALRTTLANAACCTTNAAATREGDPLNLVVVEPSQGGVDPFIARGWHLAQKLDAASILETARAFVFQDEYLTAPVSPLYAFNRREDFALQKARSTISERVHLRLWLMPARYSGRRIWIGQVSRDIGVRLTDRAWNLTTHKIGPDIDFDRNYLLQDLLMSGFVERYGFVEGIGAAPMSAPRANLTGDPYFTDGLRLVVFLSAQAKTPGEAEQLPWQPLGLTTVGAR